MKLRLLVLMTSAALFAGCAGAGAAGSSSQAPAESTSNESEAVQEETAENAGEDVQTEEEAAPAEETVSADETVSQDMAMGEEDMEFMPSDFLQELTHRDEFESYDEVISLLPSGSGYAYIELIGHEGEALAIAESTFDDLEGHNAAIDVAVYLESDGKIKNVGNAFSMGTAYPIRCQDGILYTGGNHEYDSYFFSENGGLMQKDYIVQEFDETGKATYYGFLRDSNSYENDKDVPEDGEDIFNEYVEASLDKEVVNFTVVE